MSMRDLWALIPKPDRTASDFFDRACTCSLSIDIAERAARSGFSGVSEDDVAKWRLDAVEALRQSEPDTAEVRKLIQSDSDLDAIRSLSEFKQLMEDTESME